MVAAKAAKATKKSRSAQATAARVTGRPRVFKQFRIIITVSELR